jgi:hypothetical protein
VQERGHLDVSDLRMRKVAGAGLARTLSRLGGRRRRGPAFGGTFSWLDSHTRWRSRLCVYIRREHARGRPLTDILRDQFVVEHASATEIGLLLDDPRLLDRLADDCHSPAWVPREPLPPAA